MSSTKQNAKEDAPNATHTTHAAPQLITSSPLSSPPPTTTSSRFAVLHRRDSLCNSAELESGNGRGEGKGRRTSTVSNLLGITNTNAKQTQQQVLPSKPPRTIGSRIKRRRKSINESDSRGAFDALPNELVEAILLKLDAPALASLQATSKYFRHSGVCDRVARFILATRDGEPGFDECHRGENNKEEEEEEEVALNDESDDEENRRNNNNNNKRKKRTKTTAKKMSMVPPTVGSCRVRPQDSAIAVLRFKDVMERAERASSLVSLGSFHTVRLVDRFMHCKCPGKKCECCPTTNQCRVFRVTDIESCGRGFHGQLGRGKNMYDATASFGKVDMGLQLDQNYELCTENFESQFLLSDDNDTSWYTTYEETTFVQVSAGSSHCAGLTKNGALYTWGLASSGETGHHHTPIEISIPKKVLGLLRVTKVACGSNHTLAATADGQLFSCGRGRHGQLGLGYFHDGGPLTRCDALRDMHVINVAAGGQHSVCITDDGRVWSWGDFRKGQLGLGDLRFATSAGWHTGVPWPCLVESLCEENLSSFDLLDGKDSVSKVSCGKEHTMFLTQSGRLFACGSANYGQIAQVSVLDRNVFYPKRVQIKHHVRKQDGTTLMHRVRACSCVNANQPSNGNVSCRVAQVACGGNHSLVLTGCGAVFATGSNSYGQLGLGDVKHRDTFSRVWRFHDKKLNVISVSAGEHHSAAVVSNQTVLKETDCEECVSNEEWLEAKACAYSVGGKGEYDEVHKKYAYKLYQWGRGDWGQLGHGETRGKWWPTLTKKSNESLARPSKRGDFLGYERYYESEAELERIARETAIRNFENGVNNNQV